MHCTISSNDTITITQNSSSEHLAFIINYFIKYHIHLKIIYLVYPSFSPRKLNINKYLKEITNVFFTPKK